jgi:predicted ATPase
MITRIEALNYRCLRYVAQDLGPFHILAGPNASGKSSFLDVPAMMRDILRHGTEDAVATREIPDYSYLFWMRQGKRFELAIEAQIPEHHRREAEHQIELERDGTGVDGASKATPPVCRYAIAVGEDEKGEFGVLAEGLGFGPGRPAEAAETPPRRDLFDVLQPPTSLLAVGRGEPWHTILHSRNGVASFHAETGDLDRKAYFFTLGTRKAALADLPEDEQQFPVGVWFKSLLRSDIQTLMLSPEAMRRPSPPQAKRNMMADGSSFPWVLDDFLSRPGNGLIEQWIEHVRMGLPGLRSVRVFHRPEDNHKCIVVSYANGLELPSWSLSDGTLRFLALTLLAYLPDFTGTYLIEEPENGIHPTAVELVYESLRSVYDGQVLVATHSPAVLSLAELNQVLCFDKTDEEGVRIIPGHQHPRLRHWKGEVSLGTLFAGGVLG